MGGSKSEAQAASCATALLDAQRQKYQQRRRILESTTVVYSNEKEIALGAVAIRLLEYAPGIDSARRKD